MVHHWYVRKQQSLWLLSASSDVQRYLQLYPFFATQERISRTANICLFRLRHELSSCPHMRGLGQTGPGSLGLLTLLALGDPRSRISDHRGCRRPCWHHVTRRFSLGVRLCHQVLDLCRSKGLTSLMTARLECARGNCAGGKERQKSRTPRH